MGELAENLGFNFDWQSLGEYFDRLDEIGLQFNVANLTGHSTLRAGEVEDWNNIQEEELTRMKSEMESSMKEGSIGLSTGLIYAPGCFAETEEIVELAKIAREYKGIYASHMLFKPTFGRVCGLADIDAISTIPFGKAIS